MRSLRLTLLLALPCHHEPCPDLASSLQPVLRGAASWLAGPYVALIKEPFLGTLREVCNGRALPSPLVSVLVRQVLEGLRYLHASLLVQHNDVTTNTAVLMPSGAVKLTSLGLCCAARDKMRADDPELNPRRYHADPTFAVRSSTGPAWPCLARALMSPQHSVLVVSGDGGGGRQAPERLLRLECSLFSDVWSVGLGESYFRRD